MLIFLGEKLVGANFYAFSNYASTSPIFGQIVSNLIPRHSKIGKTAWIQKEKLTCLCTTKNYIFSTKCLAITQIVCSSVLRPLNIFPASSADRSAARDWSRLQKIYQFLLLSELPRSQGQTWVSIDPGQAHRLPTYYQHAGWFFFRSEILFLADAPLMKYWWTALKGMEGEKERIFYSMVFVLWYYGLVPEICQSE